LDAGRVLFAAGVTLWLGVLVAASVYVTRRMRFPRSMYARASTGSTTWPGAIGTFISFAVAAFFVPMVVWVLTLFTTALFIYVMVAYVIALEVERRRAARLGEPEPGTAGTVSFAEFAVFLAIALPFAVGALALTVYGIANEIGGNRGEGTAGLGLGAAAWFIALFMGLFASPLLVARWRR
jgi:hypothetical protein